MKATLEFSLPDEQVEYECAVNGSKASAALNDFDQWLRAQQKYEGKESIDVEVCRKVLRQTMQDNGLHFDMMMFY